MGIGDIGYYHRKNGKEKLQKESGIIPKYTALKKKIERAFQAFRSRVTGAQAATSELKLLRPLIASLKDRPEVFFQTIKDLQFEANRAGETRLDIYRRAGRDISQFQGLFNID